MSQGHVPYPNLPPHYPSCVPGKPAKSQWVSAEVPALLGHDARRAIGVPAKVVVILL
ncbi:hypothetical protein IG631_18190 [Alternaria alternata]|nr:hypothetical protein IG631_18190 [Alternaria alternata]